MVLGELLVIVAMVAVNGVFAGYEIALTSVSLARLQQLVRENRPGAAAALRMKQSMEASLAAVQVGITLAGAIAAATGGAQAGEMIAPALREWLGVSAAVAGALAIACVVVPLTVVTIVVGELIPKVFAIRNKERVCLRLSPSMRWFAWSVHPAVWLFETCVMSLMGWGERRWRRGKAVKKTEAAELQELRAYASMARASRLIGEKQEGIILGASRLSTRRSARSCSPTSTSACCASRTRSATRWSPRTSTCTRGFPWPSAAAIRSRSWATSISRTSCRSCG